MLHSTEHAQGAAHTSGSRTPAEQSQPLTQEQLRAAIEAEIMEDRPNAPEVAQPLGGRRIRVITRTLQGDKRVNAQLFELPGYKGPQLAVSEYKTGRGQGYRVYLPKSGMLVSDNNGVQPLYDVLSDAVLRVRNIRQHIAAREGQLASSPNSVHRMDGTEDTHGQDEQDEGVPAMR